MSTIELKTNLHRLIDQINDDVILQAHLTLLSREISQPTSDFWDDLSPAQQASIDRGLADLAAGRRKPFSDILKKYTE
jgi:predicted transcriptional regulator